MTTIKIITDKDKNIFVVDNKNLKTCSHYDIIYKSKDINKIRTYIKQKGL